MSTAKISQSALRPKLKVPVSIRELLRCPVCKAKLALMGDRLECTRPLCRSSFPIIEGVPILLNENASVFSIAETRPAGVAVSGVSSHIKRALYRVLPDTSNNVKGEANYHRLAELLRARGAEVQKVLVVGGGTIGEGMESLFSSASQMELVQTDVVFDPATEIVCDGHDLPFADASFDCVIIQAVLEHVLDPQRCVAEIHRVLKTDGLVYAETPFMQQVHMGRLDFTRFTHLGHRRLFRNFEEIESGAACGPGMALAWSYRYFLLSFTQSKWINRFLAIFARLTSFPLKYFDYFVINKPGSLDAASAYYFLGRRSSRTLPDRELLGMYRGAL